MQRQARVRLVRWVVVGCSSASLLGCDRFEDALPDDLGTKVTGRVVDDRGRPVAGVEVRILDLVGNDEFVEGGDLSSASAYIDREAVLASNDAIDEARTDEDGTFTIEDVAPGAFLAVAEGPGCTAGFAGFDEETGVLNLDTLIKPSFDNGLEFAVPEFVVACATAPEVGPRGNSEEAPPYEPPAPTVTCDEAQCTAAGGTCEAQTCVITCDAQACTSSGGACVEGTCVLPACDAETCAAVGGSCVEDVCTVAQCDAEACSQADGVCSEDGTACDVPPCVAALAECEAAGGTCSDDGLTCLFPACDADEDCAAGQPGAFCSDPGDVALAACQPPMPGEIPPPAEALGWTALRVVDEGGTVLADASSDNVEVDALHGIARLEAAFDGEATRAFVHVQSGSQACPDQPPRTDSMAVELRDGAIVSETGAFLELALDGGYRKIQLSTSEVIGEGEASHTIAFGEPCVAPAVPFTATLTWDAGPGQPADLDLGIWNAAGELVFVGSKQSAWGRLAVEGKGPGPEIFEVDDPSQGPFTIKVQFFSGKPRDVEAKLRVVRTVDGVALDETFTFVVERPKDVAEIGVFAAQ